MNESNNEDWPDPTDWARRLHDRLEKIGADYISTPWAVANDPESFEGLNLKQARAAEAVITVCSALHEIPLFEKSKGVAVLHDLAGAIRDVVMGGSPKLLSPVRPGSRGGDGIYRNYIKAQVVLAVRFMTEAHGMAESGAIKLVTKAFAAAGAKGRKGNRLSATTVKDWFDRAHPLSSQADDARIYRDVESRLETFRNDPAWPGNYDDAIAWIDRIAADPLLLTKYG